MDINFLGQASFRLKGKNTTVITDPYDSSLGIKFPKTEADIVTVSHDHFDHNAANLVGGDPFVIDGPGEYEIKGVKVTGVASFHDEKKGEQRGKNVLFSFLVDGIRICHLGDLGQEELTDKQLEDLGQVDILLVPTGGVFTIDATKAAKIAASLEPKIVIPMHFQDKDTKVELEPVDKFLKEMGVENRELLPKLSVTREKLPEELTVVLLEKKA